MRRVLYSVAMSLDGYIAGPKGEFDWIPTDPEIDWGAFMSRFDTVLLGRRTYEATRAQGQAATMPGMQTLVFSTTLAPADHPNVTIVAGGAPVVIAGLKAERGKDIWLMGGGVLFANLLEAGLVDDVEVAIVPVLLGRGLRFLPPVSCTAKLALTTTRTYQSTGIVLLDYAVVH